MQRLSKRKKISKLISRTFREARKVLLRAQKVSDNNIQENICGVPTGLLPSYRLFPISYQ